MNIDPEVPGWAVFADAVLQRGALIARVGLDRLPSPFAGLRIDDEDVAQAISDLPGLRSGPPEVVAELVEASEPALREARERLVRDERFTTLASAAGLSWAEAETLALLAAVDVDPRRQRLVAYLNDDATQRFVSPFTLTQLFPDQPDRAVAVRPDGGLHRAGFVTSADDQPWSRTPLRLARLVTWRLAGYAGDDPELPARAELIDTGGAADEPGVDTDLVVVAGPDWVRRLEAAARALSAHRVLVTPVPESAAEWDAVIRQASLDGDAVLVDVETELSPPARRRIDAATQLRWAICSLADLPVDSLPRRPWRAVAPDDATVSVLELDAVLGAEAARAQPALTAEQLRAAGTAAAGLGGDMSAAIRRLAMGHIDRLATRVTPRFGWDDLVLREAQLSRVQEVVLRYRHRRTVYEEWGFAGRSSTGVLALFAGESGTGKTLSAEVIAGELGQDLYTVDLAHLVSKYIGETEKNLSAVFAAAEASPVVLFLDEADALLGKRSAVSDAHDRYANIEVAYLLQRLERHNGVVLLATNLSNNIDKAFLRRIHVSVDFPMPDVAERLRIWRRSLPAATPLEDVRLEPLAERFEMSGGSIRNAALTAAFLAAENGTGITAALLGQAVNQELRKLGRLARVEDFAEFAPDGAGGPDAAALRPA